MNKSTLYIARHGERLDFVDPEWYKKSKTPHDPPLTDIGKEQATELGRKLSGLSITHIFASPFYRCVNTACNAAAAISPDLRVFIEPGMCEWLNAEWYGDSEHGPIWRTVESLAAEFPTVDPSYEPVLPMSHNFDGYPESLEKLSIRCDKTYRAVLERFQPTGNVLFVGHGSSVEALTKVLVPEAVVASVPYCCLTECIPAEENFKYSLGLQCDTSFQTHPEEKEDIRYI